MLEWADGFDVTGAFHTIHLFGSAQSNAILAKMPRVPAPVSALIGITLWVPQVLS